MNKFEKLHPRITEQVTALVSQYTKLFPSEFEAVKQIVRQKRLDTVKSTSDVIDRPLIEYPESLFWSISRSLTDEEMVKFNTKDGQRWFGTAFPAFRIPKEI